MTQDVRYAVRTLRKSPGFTTTSVATLAIGANTAMFSVLNAVLLRPLPYRASEQLAMLWTEDPTQNLREGRSALWDVEQWLTRSHSFADMATFDSVSTTLTGADGAEQIVGASISPNLLSLLGVQPMQGRGRSVSGGAAARRIRRALVVAEFALAIVLLVGAGLLVRSWWYVNRIDPGFRPEGVLVMELSAPITFSIPAKQHLYHRVLETIQAVPG